MVKGKQTVTCNGEKDLVFGAARHVDVDVFSPRTSVTRQPAEKKSYGRAEKCTVGRVSRTRE